MMAVPLALSSQYQRVLVVVCLPELRAWEISPVCAPASGSSQLMRVLLLLGWRYGAGCACVGAGDFGGGRGGLE